MAEKDPCELFPEQEVEEEVDPEYQDTGFLPGYFGALNPTSNLSPRETTEELSRGLRPAEDSPAEILTESPLPEQTTREISAGAASRLSSQLDAEPELLENDVSLTPVYQKDLSATKSTWILNNSSLLDFGLVTLENGQLRFLSKPNHILSRTTVQSNSSRAPANVINSNYDIDPIRWVSDRMWFNAEQADGPSEYVSSLSAKIQHGKSNSTPDLYFINKDGSEIGWGVLYEDMHKRLSIKLYGTSNVSQWKNIREIRELMMSQNSLDLDIKYETHQLYAEKFLNSPENWNWANYFMGHVPREYISQIIGQDSIQRMREEANNQAQYIGWRDIYIKYASTTNKANLNPFPFVPFFGDNFTLDQSTDPVSSVSPPTVGRVVYQDYTTNVLDLLTKQEADVLDVGNKSYFDIRPVYSYYDCLYEKTFSSVLGENELPSPYLREVDFGFETSSRRSEGLSIPMLEDFEEQQFVRLEAADRFFNLNFYDNYDPSQATDTQVQETFAEILDGAAEGDPEAKRELAKHMSDYYGFNIGNEEEDIYLSRYTTEVLDEIYERRYLNPMFVEMEFGSIQKSQLAEAMTFNDDDSLVKNLFGSLRLQQLSDEEGSSVSYVDQLLQSGLRTRGRGRGFRGTTTEFSDTIPLEQTRTIDFSDWFKGIFDFYSGGGLSPAEKFANIFRLLLLKGRISRFIESRARSYREILSGVPAKNEVLGFTIDKYSIDRRGEATYLTSFHILSNNEREVEKFVDSQVKYGKIYEYRINRIVAIVGNKYTYADPDPKLSDEKSQDIVDTLRAQDPMAMRASTAVYRQTIGVVNMPFLQVMSVPSTIKRVAVSDRPPLYPNVDVIPFKNEQNRVLFNLSANCGEYLAPPVLLEDDDNLQFYTVAMTQGLESVQDISVDDIINQDFSLASDLTDAELIRFRSDDPASTFEVFRMETYPKSIQDFRGHKLRKDYTKSDNFSFIDGISPDKKYYYIFRTEDIHGHVSNPSHIYEVELVTFNEAVRLNVKIVEPEDIANKKKLERQSTRQARQFVSVKPNISQRTMQLPESGYFSDLVEMADKNEAFGEPEVERLWGKKFKLRIRSKNTGKEVDINFRFKVKVQKNEENKKVNLIC